MNTNLTTPFNGVAWTFRFWWAYLGPITFWMSFAALGRAIQMQIFGPVPTSVFYGLEVVVELARLVTLLVIIGQGNRRRGLQLLIGLFRQTRKQWLEMGRTCRATVWQQGPVLVLNLMAFGVLAFGFNKMNGLIVEQPAVFYGLKDFGLMHESATRMPLYFFLKNLNVIPFTFIFEFGLFRWLVGKWRPDDLLVQAGA